MQHLCPNLMDLINHFNYISRAVASMIAQEPKVRQRAKIYEKLILMAEVIPVLFLLRYVTHYSGSTLKT